MIFRSIIASCIFMALVTIAAYAAEIPAANEKLPSNKRGILWEQVNNDDTTGEAFWNGGCGLLEATGTQADADFELQYGSITAILNDVDSGNIPDGTRFSSATGLGMVKFDLPAGFTDIRFLSAGTGTQDLDIRLIPIKDCDGR